MKIQGRTFFVTGAASGLGHATAKRLAAAGANVMLADVNSDQGTANADAIGAAAQFIKVDVTSEADVRVAIELATSEFGPLYGAINCAGVVLGRRTVSRKGAHDLESFERVIRINLIGTFNVIRLAAESMTENEPVENGERGVIINTASVAAFDGQIGQAAYAASKGGVAAMTLPIARDLAVTGIRVASIAPGIFETPMMAGMNDEVRLSLEAQVPFPSRLGKPDEYAALVQHIIENGYLNGEVIRLDGAIRMGPK
jgi:NAD(P)-dependent dehydrogenase (short-subunit alcohol dehydrogenase family)